MEASDEEESEGEDEVSESEESVASASEASASEEEELDEDLEWYRKETGSEPTKEMKVCVCVYDRLEMNVNMEILPLFDDLLSSD